ncbi:MAG: hypothetical protein AAGI68_12215 [Planctomycetota bacterium]
MRFRVLAFEYVVVVCESRPVWRGQAVHALWDGDGQVIYLWAGRTAEQRLGDLLHELGHAWDYHAPAGDDPEALACQKSNFAHQAFMDLARQGGQAALGALAATHPGGALDAEPEALGAVDLGGLSASVGAELVYEPVIGPGGPGGSRGPAVAAGPGASSVMEAMEVTEADGGLRLEPAEEETAGGYGRETLEQRLGGGPTADCASCGRVFYAGDVWQGTSRWANHVDGRLVRGEVVDRALWCPSCGHVQRWVEGWDAVLGVPNGVVVGLPTFDRSPEAFYVFEKHLAEMRRGGAGVEAGPAIRSVGGGW